MWSSTLILSSPAQNSSRAIMYSATSAVSTVNDPMARWSDATLHSSRRTNASSQLRSPSRSRDLEADGAQLAEDLIDIKLDACRCMSAFGRNTSTLVSSALVHPLPAAYQLLGSHLAQEPEGFV